MVSFALVCILWLLLTTDFWTSPTTWQSEKPTATGTDSESNNPQRPNTNTKAWQSLCPHSRGQRRSTTSWSAHGNTATNKAPLQDSELLLCGNTTHTLRHALKLILYNTRTLSFREEMSVVMTLWKLQSQIPTTLTYAKCWRRMITELLINITN